MRLWNSFRQKTKQKEGWENPSVSNWNGRLWTEDVAYHITYHPPTMQCWVPEMSPDILTTIHTWAHLALATRMKACWVNNPHLALVSGLREVLCMAYSSNCAPSICKTIVAVYLCTVFPSFSNCYQTRSLRRIILPGVSFGFSETVFLYCALCGVYRDWNNWDCKLNLETFPLYQAWEATIINTIREEDEDVSVLS